MNTFEFGGRQLFVGQRVKWRSAGRTKYGKVKAPAHGDWIEIQMNLKTIPVRRVHVQCNVEPA